MFLLEVCAQHSKGRVLFVYTCRNITVHTKWLVEKLIIPLITNLEHTRTPYKDALRKITSTQFQMRNINTSNSNHPVSLVPTKINNGSKTKTTPRKSKEKDNLYLPSNNGDETESFFSSDADDSHMGVHNTPMKKSLLKRLWDKIIDIIVSSGNFKSKCVLICKVM